MSGFKYECERCLKRPKTKSQIGFLSNVKEQILCGYRKGMEGNFGT